MLKLGHPPEFGRTLFAALQQPTFTGTVGVRQNVKEPVID
jgi:hypothetical protein